MKRYEALFSKIRDETQVQRKLFRIYDFDHNGRISWQEYTCIYSLTNHGNTQEKIELLLNCFDTDGDGLLSREEFSLMIKEICHHSPEIEDHVVDQFISDSFEACDIKRNERIESQAFIDWIRDNLHLTQTISKVFKLELD
eukprot:TRINITY_DN3095_c0_g1_i20.p1 TRINITY_DN3095_c0_g1~~TRINITY_DN3095_c0_g1_i20.p1  ORF type:complete len:141 (+),score=20.84 TRINITY_DN3095_c0_g1_i20:295-717(+)